jgi:Ca2+-binding EF-hand superfamily protein
MIKKIDNQLETYDERVGSSLNTIQCNGQGQIAVEDLKTAMKVIKHRPDDQTIDAVVKKLDVDQDGYVVRRARARTSRAKANSRVRRSSITSSSSHRIWASVSSLTTTRKSY